VLDAEKAKNIEAIRNMPTGTTVAMVGIGGPAPVMLGADPDEHDVERHLEMGELDLAADVARGIKDEAIKARCEARILLRAADYASQA